MAFVINTNVASLTAQRSLNNSTSALSTTFKRLSSGLRVNSAADDAAGLSVSDRMTAQIRGFNQSVRNANDTISLIQVAEGALDQTTAALQRIRELAVTAANDTYIATDRADMQKEIDQLLTEVNRIANNTQFNGQVLLAGSFVNKKFHVGANSGQVITFNIGSMTTSALNSINVMLTGGESALTGQTIDGSLNANQTAAEAAITRIDGAIAKVTTQRANLGAMQNRFDAVIANLSNVSVNTANARSRITDADMASETAKLTQNSIMQQAGIAVLSQANQQPAAVLQLLK
ncbi:MAG: flagellin FliC [Magnetococcales bacterium]|nr:flagellin FliC [Magnetococcales bacterium]